MITTSQVDMARDAMDAHHDLELRMLELKDAMTPADFAAYGPDLESWQAIGRLRSSLLDELMSAQTAYLMLFKTLQHSVALRHAAGLPSAVVNRLRQTALDTEQADPSSLDFYPGVALRDRLIGYVEECQTQTAQVALRFAERGTPILALELEERQTAAAMAHEALRAAQVAAEAETLAFHLASALGMAEDLELRQPDALDTEEEAEEEESEDEPEDEPSRPMIVPSLRGGTA